MASVAFTEFLPEILLEAAGVPQPVAINAIRNACFDFCRDSLWLNEVAAQVPYTAGNATYALTAPADHMVVGVLSLNVDEKRVVNPWSLEELPAQRPAWQTAQGIVEGFIQPSLGSVTLIAVPDSDGYFIPHVAYSPTRTATTVDDRIFNHHLETIKYGALWKLKSMINQPWSDPQGAAQYEQRFLMGVGVATIQRYRTNSRAALQVTGASFV